MGVFLLGLDLGQSTDYTAAAVVERLAVPGGASRPLYHIRHVERAKLGTPYPAIVARVQSLMKSEPLKGSTRLVVDATGVGLPVVDLLQQAGLAPIPVSIHGGDEVSYGATGVWRVPKRDLVATLQVLLQTGRLKIADGLAEGPALAQEMLAFRVRIDARSGHDTFGNDWRENPHDDLVLAVALAVWYGERGGSPMTTEEYRALLNLFR